MLYGPVNYVLVWEVSNHIFFVFFHGKPLFYFQKTRDRHSHQENLMKERVKRKKKKQL